VRFGDSSLASLRYSGRTGASSLSFFVVLTTQSIASHANRMTKKKKKCTENL
jgi:hypothetical protein